MKIANCYVGFAVALISLTTQFPAHAVVIDVSEVSFTSFAPNPIAPGQHPTTFGYAFHYDKESNGAVSAGFSFTITFSSDAILGGSDDHSLGTFNPAAGSVAGISGDRSQTSFIPNGFASFQVPRATPPGIYNAFLQIAPRSPHTDPDSSDTFSQLAGMVTVKPNLAGDYNGNNIVDAADYAVWRDRLGSSFDLNGNGDETGGSAGVVDQADYAYWISHFGEAAGSGSLTIGPVPEPSTLMLLILAAADIRLRGRRFA